MQEVQFEKANDYASALETAAEECGIYREYWDILHQRREASPDVLRRILETLGWDVSSLETLERERAARFRAAMTEILPRTAVVSEAEKSVPLTLDENEQVSICFEIRLEHGE